jgi:putative oxidoreductase
MGRLLLRMLLGGLFLGHAAQKLLGWFGGQGPDQAAEGFEKMGLRPGKRNVVAAGLAESAGGAMLATGYETPLASAMLIGTMLTAIKHAGWRNGLWNTNGGYEYNLVLAAAALALADSGPGRLSLDAAHGHERKGALWAVAALAAGVAGALGVEALAKRESPQLRLATAGAERRAA